MSAPREQKLASFDGVSLYMIDVGEVRGKGRTLMRITDHTIAASLMMDLLDKRMPPALGGLRRRSK